MRNRSMLLVALLASGLTSACSWVEPSPQAEQVRVVPADRVADCRQLGDLSSYTRAEIIGIDRSAGKIRQELETLARNEAAELGADTIVAASPVVDGRRRYLAYRCL